jgi:hypothetical protein
MNSILHIPSAVRVAPAILVAGQEPVPNQYSVEVTYKANMPAQRFHRVHASALAATALQNPALRAIHLVTLRIGSPEQRVLPNRPSQVVLGVQFKSGETVVAVPKEWLSLQRRGFLLGSGLVVLSLSILISNFGVIANMVAASAFAMGALRIGAAQSIHTKPFWVNEGWWVGLGEN